MAEAVTDFEDEMGLARPSSPQQPLTEDVLKQDEAAEREAVPDSQFAYPSEVMDIMNQIINCRFCKRSSKDRAEDNLN